jgi:diguanylate cyclase (GGDEF)-like protein
MTEDELQQNLLRPSRLQALRETGLLDSAAEDPFDRIIALAAQLIDASSAGLSFVDDRREFLKGQVGIKEPWGSLRELPLSHSLAKYVVAMGDVFAVDDVRADPRLMKDVALAELGIGAYLGIALQVEGAASLGALWVADAKPRHWSEREQKLLRELAGLVVREIGLASMLRLLQRSDQIHKALVENMPDIITQLTNAERALREKSSLLESILEAMEESVVVCDREGKPVMFNQSGRKVFGAWYAAAAASVPAPPGSGVFLSDQVTPCPPEALPLQQALQGQRVRQMELFVRPGDEPSHGRWESINAAPLRDLDGSIRGAISVSRENTVMREASLQLLEQTRQASLVQQVAVAANLSPGVDETLREALAAICTYTTWPLAHVYLPHDGRMASSDLWISTHLDRFQSFVDASMPVTFGRGEGIVGKVFESGRPVFVDRLANSTFRRWAAAEVVGFEAGFFLPVLASTEVVAVIELFLTAADPRPGQGFTEAMENVGAILGRVFERERSRRVLEAYAEEVRALSLIDELTGLYNRRGFFTLAEQQIRLGQRARMRHHLFFADLDGMKVINDRYGHAQGDEALRDTSRLLRTVFRESDIVARLGGDEFAALAASPTKVGPERVLQRLRKQLDAHNALRLRPFVLEVSLGATLYDPARPVSLEELLAEADELMYAQKRKRAK